MGKSSKQDDKSRFVRFERERLEEVSEFLFQIGQQFVNAKNAPAALDSFLYSAELNPKNHNAVYNMGCLYSVLNRREDAYRAFKEADRMFPDNIQTLTSLAEVTRKLGRTQESEFLITRLLARDPENYMILSAAAILYYDMGRLAEAREMNERALERRPGDLFMLLNRALLNMTYGLWPQEWSNYEYCLSYQRNEKMKALSMAKSWGGEEREGRTLVVVSDQGSGDAIQFSRYLMEAKALGKFAKIIFLVQPELVELMTYSAVADEVVGFSERERLDYDDYSSLLGIMRVLKISPEDAHRPPHLWIHGSLVEHWAAKIDTYAVSPDPWNARPIKVGLVWAGDPRHGNDHARSIPLELFLDLIRKTSKPNVFGWAQWYSLQVGEAAKKLEVSTTTLDLPNVIDLGSDFRSFSDTCAALSNLDLLITCDTSVAHLAGCMNVRTWLLLANPPEWRWLLDRQSTPWYGDNFEIFRQRDPKDWSFVIAAVAKRLEELLSDQDDARYASQKQEKEELCLED